MNLNKKDIVRLLEEIALYLEIKGENPFRISAYRKAAQALERDVRSLNEIDDFSTIDGIGKATKEIIEEYITTGSSSLLEELQAEIPASLLPLLKLPGLGGKRVSTLYKELNITDLASLKKACEDGSILSLRGFGKKTVDNILQAIDSFDTRPERLPIAYMLELAKRIEVFLEKIENIEAYTLAGSLRRMEETVKDIDFIIATEKPDKVTQELVQFESIKDVLAKGPTKVSLTLEDEYDVNVDFRLVSPEAYATTLHHFTGSKEHNVRMRQLAKKQGEKINEYGVTKEKTGELLSFPTEEAFFQHFNLHYIPAELRQGTKEFQYFARNSASQLLEEKDIKGDLHMHTTWSDGAHSIEEMVEAARSRNYDYIAITDHSKFLRVANGLDEKRLRQQREEIEALREKYDDIHIFAGVEMDILPNGELDFSDEFLQEMDFVIAAIHSSFQQSQEEIHYRLQKACENPYVHMIAHPTGRIIGRRQPYNVDVDWLIELAKETKTALELNANPMRFDLRPEFLEKASSQGVPIVINTDAHQTNTLHHMAYGVKVARKAWLKPEDIVNSWSIDKLKAFLVQKRGH